jgi:hypothetical protein
VFVPFKPNENIDDISKKIYERTRVERNHQEFQRYMLMFMGITFVLGTLVIITIPNKGKGIRNKNPFHEERV